MSEVNAEAVQAALASIYEVAADRNQMSSTALSIIRTRLTNLRDLIDQQRHEAGPEWPLVIKRIESERDEFKRLFSECHPIHLDGVLRARAAEAKLDAVREYARTEDFYVHDQNEAHKNGVRAVYAQPLEAILDRRES